MRKEIIKKLALDEGVPYGRFLSDYEKGFITVVKNKFSSRPPLAIGRGLKVKINANIGLSPLASDIKSEMKKLGVAVKYGADAVMDLSCGRNFLKVLKEVLAHSPVAVGTVPVYHLFSNYKTPSPDNFFEIIEEQLSMGVDFITVHCGVTQKALRFLEKNPRLGGVVSRGGGLIFGWMKKTGLENPLYEDYGRLLKIGRAHV